MQYCSSQSLSIAYNKPNIENYNIERSNGWKFQMVFLLEIYLLEGVIVYMDPVTDDSEDEGATTRQTTTTTQHVARVERRQERAIIQKNESRRSVSLFSKLARVQHMHVRHALTAEKVWRAFVAPYDNTNPSNIASQPNWKRATNSGF